jgi:hypothetical protein
MRIVGDTERFSGSKYIRVLKARGETRVRMFNRTRHAGPWEIRIPDKALTEVINLLTEAEMSLPYTPTPLALKCAEEDLAEDLT